MGHFPKRPTRLVFLTTPQSSREWQSRVFQCVAFYEKVLLTLFLDSLRGSSVKIGTIQRILAWPLRKGSTHKSRRVYFCSNVKASAWERILSTNLTAG